MQKLNSLKNPTKFSKNQLTIFIAVFALIGGYLIYRSFATAPLVASLEAEQMVLPTGASVVTDSSASSGKAMYLPTNATTTGSVNFPSSVTSLSLIAKGTQCNGAPAMNVRLDGTSLLANQAVSNTSWSSFAATPAAAINSGTHSLSISFANDYSNAGHGKKGNGACSRALYLDITNFYGPTVVTPAPTVTLSASPTSVTAGSASTLTWNSTDATACTASGAWSGSQPVQGSTSTGALNQSSTYTLTCTGTGGSAVGSAVVSVAGSTSTGWGWDAQSAGLDSNSSTLVQTFLNYAVVNPNLVMNNFAVATADSASSSPCYNVPLTSGGNADPTVCIPLGTKPDPSADGHLTIRDTIHNRETDFWQAKYDSTSQKITSASAGTSFPLGSVNEQTTGWGGDAANLPLRRGLITPDEIKAGAINHPLVFSTPFIGSGSPRYPAIHNAATCGSSCANHLVEGTWMRLSSNLNCSGLGLPSWQTMICVAMQKYGMFLRDNGGSLGIYGQNPINGGTTWSDAGLSGNSAGFSSAFPWAQLQVLNPPSQTTVNKLTWAPPTLNNPVDVTIADTGCAACNSIPGQDSALPWVVSLDPTKDYRLHVNHRTGLHGLSINGGHNVVMIGGSVTADADYGSFATGIVIQDIVGTFHIEGMDIGGQYMGDAIRVQHNSNIAVQSTSSSVIQVENCRLFSQVAPGHTIAEGHPDAFQVGYQFPGQIRFDEVTMNIGYQGFTFGPAGAEGVGNGVYINRTNAHMHLDTDGSSPNVYLFQQDEATAAIHTNDQFWGDSYNNIGIEGLLSPGFYDGRVGTPNTGADKPVIGSDTLGKYVTYPSSANIAGKIRQGTPPSGDFVPSGSVGANYVSPGYL